MKFKEILTLIRQTFQEWNEDKAPRLAAALSYYTIFSLAPLLVLVIAITGFIVGNNDAIRVELVRQVHGLVGQQGADAVNELIANANRPQEGALATIIGVITLLIGATGVFGQLQESLNTIWEVKPKQGRGIKGVLKNRLLSFTMVLGVSFLLLVSLVVSTALSVINNYFTDLLGSIGPLVQVLNIVLSIGVITLIFALIFKILPDVAIRWSDVWLGALVTAVLFTIGRTLISIYLGSSATASTYGAAASLVILLLWVYYSAQILFIGAEFTQVYARQRGSRITPVATAIPVTESERAHQGIARRQQTVKSVQRAMIPVIEQPEIYSSNGGERARIRYKAPNPGSVTPVIAGGAVAGIYTLGRILYKAGILKTRKRA